MVVAMTCRCHNSRPHHVFWQTNPNRQACVTVASFARPSFPNPFVGTCRDGEIKKKKKKKISLTPVAADVPTFCVCVCVIRIAQLTHSVRLSRWIFLITIKCNARMLVLSCFFFLFFIFSVWMSCLFRYFVCLAIPTRPLHQRANTNKDVVRKIK